MKIDLLRLSTAYIALKYLSKIKMPVQASYFIFKNIKAMENEAEFYNNQKLSLYDECLEKDDNGDFLYTDKNMKYYKIKEDKTALLKQSLSELNNTEVEIDIYKINIDTIIDSNVEIEPSVFESIDFLIY